MGNNKKKGKFFNFIQKAAKIVPEVLQSITQLSSGNVLGAIGTVRDILEQKSKTSHEATELLQEFKLNEQKFALESFNAEFKDRVDARKLYSTNDFLQKIFALTFLIGYAGLCYFLIQILFKTSDIPELAQTLITMIWTGTSTKLNTIVDFFFGGSVNKS